MKVLILDNSVATTGACLSALAMAGVLRDDMDFLFVLPTGSACHAAIKGAGNKTLSLPMVEIGRSMSRLAAYLPMLLLNGWRLRRILADHNIDVLLANDYFNQLPLMVRIMGWRGPTVTLVRLLPSSQMPVLNRLWLKSMWLSSTTNIAVSQAVLRQLPAWLEPQLVYFPVGRGIDEAEYVPPSPHAGCRFLFLANFIRGKGQEMALSAFARVLNMSPDATLRIVGGDMGLEKNSRFRRELELEVERLGLAHCVTFAGPTDDVIGEIRSADVLLNFSQSESFSQTCVEAGRLGRPVVATRCGGPEEIILDGETGFLVHQGDTVAAAEAMCILAMNPVLRRDMGIKARLHLSEMLCSDAFRMRMISLLKGFV